jgi:glycosyltransferase involved in cell wall biosynthesis
MALFRLVRVLRGLRVDLVHIHSLRAAVFGIKAASVLRLPTTITVHVPVLVEHASGPKRWAYHLAEKVLWAWASRLIFPSARLLALSGAPSETSCVVENGVDVSPRAEGGERLSVRRELGVPEGACVVLAVARLEAQKGLDVLLEAVALLASEEVRVLIVGGGSERDRLERQAQALGLSDRVMFLGPREDVPTLLRTADVFVLPSRYEATPIALLEAMAAGLPCVATDVGDTALMLSNGSGRVVPPGEKASLGEALKELVSDRGLRSRLGQLARQAVEAYSDHRMMSRTLDVYDQALSSSGKK